MTKCKICKKHNDWMPKDSELDAMIDHLHQYHFSKYVDCIRKHFEP